MLLSVLYFEYLSVFLSPLYVLARTAPAVVLGDHPSPFASFISPVHEHKRTRLLHQVLARLLLELDFHSGYQPLRAADIC